MTVAELIKELEKFDQNLIVCIDQEGMTELSSFFIVREYIVLY